MNKGLNIVYLDQTRKNEIEHFLSLWEDACAFVECATSGSTGTPSMVRHAKSNMRVSAQKTIAHLELGNGGTAYLCLSASTIAGMMMIVRAIEAKMTLIVGPVSSDSLDNIKESVDFAAIVPLQLSYILKKDPSKLKLLKKLIIGGAPVSEDLIRQLYIHELSLYQTYGMTETISHVAMRKIGREQEKEFSALNGIHFSSDEDGTLIIHYPEIGIDKLKTNDIVALSDSEHFSWIGRKDFTINTGGVKVQPEHIEKILSEHISLPFFVTSMPSEELGEQVVLLIQDQKKTPLNQEAAFQNLSRFEKPKCIYYLDQFVYSGSGKILRKETAKKITA